MSYLRFCTALLTVIASLAISAGSHKICSNIYGSEPCTFLPAPPGKTPPCAQPGLTYCEHPEHYPSQRIQYLIQKWRYDHSTLIQDESKEEFTAYFYPPPTYKYGPPNTLKDSYFPEPIYIPKPQYPFEHTPVGNSYIPPKLNYTAGSFSGGYPERRPAASVQFSSYKYSNNIPAVPHQGDVYGPAQSIYSAFTLPHVSGYNNKIWSRKEDKFGKEILSRKRRSFLISNNLRKLKSLSFDDASNSTSSLVRRKRQGALVGEALCPTRSQYIMPRAALNNKGNWMYVVNMAEMDTRYSQLVKSETCAGQTCNLCQLPVGYSSRCEQKYVQKRLVALEGAGNELYTDVFWFPSCCVCTVSNR